MSGPAELRREVSPISGAMRLRCTGCEKIAYATRERAEEAAEKISGRAEMDVYLDEDCGWWHLTRSNGGGG